MATKVYRAPDDIKKPVFDYKDVDGSLKAEEEYIEKLKQFAKDKVLPAAKSADRQYIGEEIRFPVADGYARYIVYSISPVALVHIDTGDGWQFSHAGLLTAKAVKQSVASAKALAKLFGE